LTKAAGFQYQYDDKSGQFAHATAIVVLTPGGKIAQYYYGVEYAPKDLRLGLIQASENKIGNLADQVLLYCYHYDPTTGRYGAIVSRILQLSGLVGSGSVSISTGLRGVLPRGVYFGGEGNSVATASMLYSYSYPGFCPDFSSNCSASFASSSRTNGPKLVTEISPVSRFLALLRTK
jgi:hypothetical protein